MSRPRKPFGANHPGRLPATMMKVLAAEMSDPQRLRRGKQYAKDGSVLDIIVEPGWVTCEVQGSRSTPYIATIQVTSGDGMPLRRDITAGCSCPDADNWDNEACKHVIAAMFTLSDEFLVEPELLDIWRNRSVGTDAGADPSGDASATPRTATRESGTRESGTPETGSPVTAGRRHLRLVSPDERESATGRIHDRLEPLLAAPDGTALPELPDLDRLEPVLPRSPQLAAVLRDAIAHLRIDWD